MRSFLLALSVFAFAAVAEAEGVSTDPKQAPTGRYAVETGHSLVLFAISHQDLTEYYGRFDRLSGSLNYDAAEPEKSAVSVSIDMTSVDVPSRELTETLGGDGVFDAKDFPAATFKSTSIVRTGPSTGKITGDLTIKNVTKPVTLDATFEGGRLNAMSDSYALGFHATTTIKRTDFGITGMRWEPFVGDDVTLTIEAMFVQQKG
jgi:polyisoprenoid-binding protein YceI